MRKSSKRRWGLAPIIILLLALAAGGYYFWGLAPQTAAATEVPLQTARVRSGDISILVNGSGKLVAAARIELGFRSGGTVVSVPVQVGWTVAEGDLLVVLDDSAARLTLAEKELALQALISPDALISADIARLSAQGNLDKAISELQYFISPAVYRAEQNLLEAQRGLDGKKDANSPADEITAAESALSRAESALKTAQYLYTAEYVPATFTTSYRDATTRETIETIIPPSGDTISLARAKVQAAQLALEDARQYYARLSGNTEPCADLTSYGALTSKLTSACLAVQSAQLTLENTRLSAPTAGTVTVLNTAAGQSVGTSPVVAIASDEMFIQLYLEETDLAFVQSGMPVRVVFDAYPEEIFEGIVTRVDPELVTVSNVNYVSAWATVELPAGKTFLSGMSAEVEVVSGEALSTLLIPVQALRELAPGSYAVFVLQEDGTLKFTPVKIGLRDFATVEILDGLKGGEVVSTGVVETK
jgi:RND family efflux transporter MFP subunit